MRYAGPEMSTGLETQGAVNDESRTYRIAVFESGRKLVTRLRAALGQRDGPQRWVIASRSRSQALSPHLCKLLIIDIDGQPNQQLELLAECRQLYPYLPVVALVERGETATAVAAMKAGAVDCLEKPVEPGRLLSLAETMLQRRQSAYRDVSEALTTTEARVLHLILAGNTNLQIARQVHRSKRTIEVHRANIMRKLGTSSVSELVCKAFGAGLFGREPCGHPPGSDEYRLESLS